MTTRPRSTGTRIVDDWQLPNTAKARIEFHALSHLEQEAYAHARDTGLNHKRALQLVHELADEHNAAQADLIDGYVR